jgi:hypothetical protein
MWVEFSSMRVRNFVTWDTTNPPPSATDSALPVFRTAVFEALKLSESFSGDLPSGVFISSRN